MPAVAPQDDRLGLIERALDAPVVVGFDGSPAANRALDLVAKTVAPSVRVLVVAVEPDVHSRGLLAEPLLEPGNGVEALLAAARDRVLDVDPSRRVETVACAGNPGSALIEIARENAAGLIVLGGRGENFEARLLLGSVAAHVAEHAHCDVLVVR
jgi:nucleotide-binding universal stress UspA family protein